MSKIRPKIVCIGGGTGVPLVMRGLKSEADLTAIITMFDNGSSGGFLRRDQGIPPVGDIRQCLVNSASLEAADSAGTISVRFSKGIFKGHTLGNLYIAAVIEKTGSLEKAIEELKKNLKVEAEIYPVTLESADIKAELNDGVQVKGEEEILNYQNLSQIGIKELFLEPKAEANPKAIAAIKNADLIIIGPGKFYTSVISNLLADGLTTAINESKAKKVFICNLMIQSGNTDNFKVEDFIREIEKYLKGKVDYVIFNTGKLPESDYQRVKYGPELLNSEKFIGADIVDQNIHQPHPSDVLAQGANQRTRILHDTNKLAKVILKLCKL